MGDKKENPTFDFSKLNFDFGGAASGFQFDPSQGNVIGAIQDRLAGLVGAPSGYLESLPSVVRQRVKALRILDKKYDALEEQFEKEIRALELKYHNEHYKPIFQKRAAFISGAQEPTEEDLADDDEEEEEEENKEEKKEEAKEETEEDKNIKGIPDFWLTVLKHHDLFESVIHPKDEEALKFLTDITYEPVEVENEEEEQGSFVLNFHFAENPFFSNKVLSKTYHLQGDTGEEVTCESVDSSQIHWKAGKSLTKNTKRKMEGEKGSFFNFFAPPETKEGQKPSRQIVTAMEMDFEMAVALKEDIIKHAVSWFTGEAGFMLGEDDDDEEGEGEEEGEYDSEEDGDFVPQNEGAVNPQECKQQ